MPRHFALFLSIALLSAAATEARLPRNVIPKHYAITISPDLGAETFSGDETIDVDLTEPLQSITLNAIDLDLRGVTAKSGAKTAHGSVSTVDAKGETITLEFDEPIPAGGASLQITFNGKLGKQLRGLYLSKTEKRKYAVTQFEATDARRAFPSFDEPDLKATFDITLVVDEGDTAISNGAMVSDTKRDGGKHAIRFATTPRLSTYLLAMLIGDFRCSEGGIDGIPIRVCSTPGKESLTRFALSAAAAEVHFYNEYFAIKYPFGKLDLIGIPDFEAGAMENAGAITFRESSLLVDESSASFERRSAVANTIAHEIAHMWFGDLVTMKWWNDIWLNEGFATFMTRKPVAAWQPTWHVRLDDVTNTGNSIALDSQRSTRAIRTNAETSAEINELFDGIAYGKTAAVLRMIENWLGEDAFRDGIRAYLKKYSWSNAAAEDFWSTMAASTGKPVDAVMRSFVEQAGAPLLHVTESCATTNVGRASARQSDLTLTQERMRAHNAPPNDELWSLPLCTRTLGANDYQCTLLAASREQRVERGACAPVFANAGGRGYYVSQYDAASLATLRRRIKALTADERISLHGDTWLLVRNARIDAGEYLALVAVLPRPADRVLVSELADNLVYITNTLVTDKMRAAWQRRVQSLIRGYSQPVWMTPPGTLDSDRVVRGDVLWALGYAAGDEDVIKAARHYAEKYIANPNNGDAVLADRALPLAASHGDARFYEKVTSAIEQAPTPELRNRYYNALANFSDPKLVARTLDFVFSGAVRTQDLPRLLAEMLYNPPSRAATWSAVKSHWPDLQRLIPNSLPSVVRGLGSFCDAGARADVEHFFADHPTEVAKRTLARALESMETCQTFVSIERDALAKALATK
jgi:aminopeptidase N